MGLELLPPRARERRLVLPSRGDILRPSFPPPSPPPSLVPSVLLRPPLAPALPPSLPRSSLIPSLPITRRREEGSSHDGYHRCDSSWSSYTRQCSTMLRRATTSRHLSNWLIAPQIANTSNAGQPIHHTKTFAAQSTERRQPVACLFFRARPPHSDRHSSMGNISRASLPTSGHP